jgi:hypothetical protein
VAGRVGLSVCGLSDSAETVRTMVFPCVHRSSYPRLALFAGLATGLHGPTADIAAFREGPPSRSPVRGQGSTAYSGVACLCPWWIGLGLVIPARRVPHVFNDPDS